MEKKKKRQSNPKTCNQKSSACNHCKINLKTLGDVTSCHCCDWWVRNASSLLHRICNSVSNYKPFRLLDCQYPIALRSPRSSPLLHFSNWLMIGKTETWVINIYQKTVGLELLKFFFWGCTIKYWGNLELNNPLKSICDMLFPLATAIQRLWNKTI